MHDDTWDEYDAWDVSLPELPPRSTLYSLSPIGISTPQVESLTSYLTRLAEAHCLFSGTLIRKMIAPLAPGYPPLEKRYGPLDNAGERSNLLNGGGLPAVHAVQALSALTLRTDLRYLTCLPLTAVLRDPLRLRKAWCPLCYGQWRMEGKVLYDPLLWTFQEITTCTRHHQRLSTCCPYPDCARFLPGIGRRSRVGYCSSCQRWLGIPSDEAMRDGLPLEEHEWLWQQWVTQTTGEVLASFPERTAFPEQNRIQRVLVHAGQNLTESNISAFARALSLQCSTVYSWYHGKNLPELSQLFQLCYRLGLSLQEMFFQEVEMLQPRFQTSSLLEFLLKKKPALRNDVSEALEKIITDNEQPPPTLRQIERRLGISRDILRRSYPSACREIVLRYRTYVQQQTDTKFQRIRGEIQQAILQLRSEGLPLTQGRISLLLSQPGILRDPRIRTLLREILMGETIRDTKSVV